MSRHQFSIDKLFHSHKTPPQMVIMMLLSDVDAAQHAAPSIARLYLHHREGMNTLNGCNVAAKVQQVDMKALIGTYMYEHLLQTV